MLQQVHFISVLPCSPLFISYLILMFHSLPALFCNLISLKLVFSDGDIMSYSTKDDGICGRSTIYRLDIAKIELFSVYGIQVCILYTLSGLLMRIGYEVLYTLKSQFTSALV